MPHPAVYIATGVVETLFAVYVAYSEKKEKPQSYRGRQDRSTHCSPPPSPPPSSTCRRQCSCCGNSPFIKINPCGHELCRSKSCLDYLENHNTCPDCGNMIDSCSPLISPFGNCRRCRRFKKLFKFLPCNHSLSLCILCFKEQHKSYQVCPTCNQQIQGSEPCYATAGVCGVCNEFTRFGTFQPCGHSNFCTRHALYYLADSNQECSECGRRVSSVD